MTTHLETLTPETATGTRDRDSTELAEMATAQPVPHLEHLSPVDRGTAQAVRATLLSR